MLLKCSLYHIASIKARSTSRSICMSIHVNRWSGWLPQTHIICFVQTMGMNVRDHQCAFLLANVQPPRFLSFPPPQTASMNLIFVLWMLATVSYRGKTSLLCLFFFLSSFLRPLSASCRFFTLPGCSFTWLDMHLGVACQVLGQVLQRAGGMKGERKLNKQGKSACRNRKKGQIYREQV